MKTILAFLSLLILSNTYAQIGIGVAEDPPRVSYKTGNPDSTKLPLNRQEVYSLCSYLQPGAENPQITKEADKIWEALIDPVNFDSREEPNCSWMAGEDPKPILAIWSQTNEMEFTRKVLFKKFFCSFPSSSTPVLLTIFMNQT